MGAMSGGSAWVPTHPGELLREDVLPALGVSISAAAEGMQISRQTLHAVLSGRASVTPEMALRIGRYTDTEPELWLRMQQARDLRLTAEGMEGKLTAIVP